MRFLLLCLILFCVSCAHRGSEVKVVTAFSQNGQLQATVKTIPVPVLMPRYIGIAGNYLYVYKEREENLFAFFHLSDGAYIQDAGTRGQGPHDFVMPDTRSFHTEGDDCFTLMDVGCNMLKTVKYDGEKLMVIHTETPFGQGAPTNGFYELDDSVALTLGRIESNAEFCLLDRKTGQLTEVGEYPKWIDLDLKADTPPMFVFYLKTCVAHPDKRKFASFYGRFKRLRIYNNEVKLLHDVDVKIDPCFTRFDEEIENRPVYYMAQPYATERYIYALCANSKTGVDRCELQIWDWEGRPVACYQFDRKLSMMTISLKYKKIYALDNQIDSELYVYDLPLLD